MSVHVFSPHAHDQVGPLIQGTAPAGRVKLEPPRGGVISSERSEISFTVDAVVRLDPKAAIGAKSKVNFWGFKPLEHEKTAQETIEDDAELKGIMDGVIEALQPVQETSFAS